MRPRGLIPTPRFKLARQMPFRPRYLTSQTAFLVLPPGLTILGNGTFGCCVTSGTLSSMEAYQMWFGGPKTLTITDQEAIEWASNYGYLNGADLTDVDNTMQTDGITVNGITYKCGPNSSVDYTQDAIMRTALMTGPVQLGIAASQLEGVVGSTNGWVLTGASQDGNEDHDVEAWGFGALQDLIPLFQALGVSITVPGGMSMTVPCYAIYTWATVGIMDQPSLVNMVGEAHLRTPTCIPGPTPTPVPMPPLPPTPIPGPGPVIPMSGVTQVGVYSVSWTATLNDPAPPIGP